MVSTRDRKASLGSVPAHRVIDPEPKQLLVAPLLHPFGLFEAEPVLPARDLAGEFIGWDLANPGVELHEGRRPRVTGRAEWPSFLVTLDDALKDPFGNLASFF